MKRAYFFHNNVLLLPSDFPDSQIDGGVPLELAGEFTCTDIFQTQSLDEPGSMINIVSVAEEAALPDNWKSIPVRQLLSMYAAGSCGNVAEIIRAVHISQWKRYSRFCGCCGAENEYISSTTHQFCPNCEQTEFPRICPAIIVLITDDQNRILLAHNEKFKKGLYSHISGFTEAGESLEETVVREVREEVGIEIKDIVYIKSQAWPFPNSLMLGFKARYASGTPKPDGIEIEDVQWFTKETLPEFSAKGSLSRYLIDCWLEGSL